MISVVLSLSTRVLKRYNLNYHLTSQDGSIRPREAVVPGATTTMSSYIGAVVADREMFHECLNKPSFSGTILSLDDFLLTSAGLATTETSLFIYNKTLFGDVGCTEVSYILSKHS